MALKIFNPKLTKTIGDYYNKPFLFLSLMDNLMKASMKKISEIVIRKDSSIGKIQFDKEWFYAITDIEDYLNEDLTGVETVTLQVMYDGNPVAYTMKSATWEDIERVRHKEPLEEFKGSVLRKK